MRRSLLGVLASLLLCGAAQAQTAPAQMGITPTTTPEVLQVLDRTNTWVPLGTVDPFLHIFNVSGGSGGSPPVTGGGNANITNVLTGLNNQSARWMPEFIAGIIGPSGNFLGGTEGRQFAAKNAHEAFLPGATPQLYWGNSYWMDQPGPEGPQNAQILVLTGPERQGNLWTQDVSLGATGLPAYAVAGGGASYCPTDNPVCALAVSALQVINWQYDNSQNGPFSPMVQTVVASSWWEGSSSTLCPSQTPVFVWTKNNTTGDLHWYQTLLACDPGTGNGTPQVRAFGAHIDQVLLPTTPTQFIFAGEAPSGIFVGQLSHSRGATLNPIIWNTGIPNMEWNSSVYPTTPAIQCTAQIRPMGFAEATGSDGKLRIYMSACFAIYVRIDGNQGACTAQQVFIASACQPRWQLYWTHPNPGVSMSGLRGLTAIPGENILLTGAEGSSTNSASQPAPLSYYSIQPYPACINSPSTCYSVAYNVHAGTGNATGGMSIGNTVAPYNNWVTVNDEFGNPHYVAPQSSYITSGTGGTATMTPPWTFMFLGNGATGKKLAEAIYTYRNSVGRYNFGYIPQLFSTPMNGIRDMVMSPFDDDCGYYGSNVKTCAIYATGNDMDGAGSYYWCKANPCPASPPFVPSHNLAWIAKLEYPWP